MEFTFRNIFALLLCSIFSSFVTAEDIELYVNHNVELDEKPRVLLIFDTSASMNFSTNTGNDCGYNGGWILCPDNRLNVAQTAMKNLITQNTDVDFGLMRFNGVEGGYVLNGIGSEPETIKTSIDNLNANGGTPLTETLWEAYLYITGKNLDFALNIALPDRDTKVENITISQKTVEQCGYERVGNGWGARWKWVCRDVIKEEYNYAYISPFADSVEEAKRCDNSVNIIYMTDGDPTANDDNQRDNNISQLYKYYFSRNLDSDNDVMHGSYLHQLARIIHGKPDTHIDLYPDTPDIHETARLYTIGFGSGMSNEGKALLTQAAKNGGGDDYFVDDADGLFDVLNQAVSSSRKENSTFISPSFASNNVDQTRSRDAIYLAMFYPDLSTRWRGNLKKLKVSGNKIIDSSLNPGLSDDGSISKEAKTFWSIDDSKDGNSVKSGGVNATLADMSKKDIQERKIFSDMGSFYFSSDSDDDLGSKLGHDKNKVVPYFSNSDSTVKANELEDIINWARGTDVDNENSSSLVRNDIFGDPLHSKPVAIDYGNNDIRILIGTNAGFLHMFKDDDVKNEVEESWAFIPSALFNILKPLRNKESGKKYGMDGPISVYSKNESLNSDNVNDGIVDATKGDEVWAFAGMRRGGRNYYGFNITTPDSPELKWTIEGGKGEFAKLGQTWSKPQVAFIKAFGDKPLLVFGGGYDKNKDISSGADSVGNNVYIVDATTGTRLWSLLDNNSFEGTHSIAADVTLLDSDYDGFIDRIYAADTGGNIWRIDMPGEKAGEFSHFKLAELGGSVDRRFFYKPMVARTLFSKVTINEGVTTRLDTPFDAIVIGSGKRTNPNDAETADQLFMIRDENTVTQLFSDKKPDVIKPDNLMVMNDDPFGNALNNVTGFIELEAKLGAEFKGWRYRLAAGEKSLAAATVIGGVAYFTSFTPASESSTKNQCSLSGGGGSLYAFHLHYGTKVYDDLKFATSTEVPDTPQLYFGSSCADANSDGKCDDDPDKIPESKFYFPGPLVKGVPTPWEPGEINGPNLNVVDGTIKLLNSGNSGFGFKTRQTYIYKREENDEVNN